jgi:hypothetical protein
MTHYYSDNIYIVKLKESSQNLCEPKMFPCFFHKKKIL